MKRTFRPSSSHTIMAGLLVCLLVAGVAVFWALSLYNTLSGYRSPLSDRAPQPGPALGQPATRKVVFVLIDALRLDTSLKQDTMPVLNQLRQQGATAVMHSRPPSYSQPGYSTLLIGAWPALNSGPLLNRDYPDIATWTQDDLFSAAHRAGIKTAVSGYNWFEKLIPQAAVDAHFYTPGEDELADQDVLAAALPWLDQNFGLVLIHIDQLDYAGHHQGGPLSPAWTAAAQRSDQMLAAILAKLDLTRDTILVCSDHGQIDTGGHGGTEAVTLTEPWVLAGAGVKPGQYGDVNMVDVAPTLAALLGANLPASTQGQVRQEMLDLPAGVRAALPGATQAQQTRLVEAYTQAIDHPLAAGTLPQGSAVPVVQQALEQAAYERLYLERVPRWLMAGFVLLLIAGLLTRLPRRTLAWAYGGALLSQVVFHAIYTLIEGHPYSMSWVPGILGMIQDMGILTAAGLTAGWLLTLLGLRAFRQTRATAVLISLGYLLAVFSLLLLPLGVHYAINGALVTWTVPDMLFFTIGLMALIQLALSAILGLVLTGLGALAARKPRIIA